MVKLRAIVENVLKICYPVIIAPQILNACCHINKKWGRKMDMAIEVKDLTKCYGEILAVDHISFDVKEGEIFGFLGPNGAGKTTTIRMLTGLSRPTGGCARVLGFDVKSELVKAKKCIGVVPEASNLYDELSALDNLVFMARLYGIPRSQRKTSAEELLKIFGLYERKDHLFGTFSRGMKRALTIAAALMHNPKLLFLDEPTVGLDVVAARSLRNLIINLRHQGITVFLTTHYLEEADLLCDRIAILVKGRILKIDTPEMLKAVAEEESIIEVSFKKMSSKIVEGLSEKLPKLKVVATNHNKLRIYGGVPAHTLEKVLQYAKDEEVEIDKVNSIKPSLEDAFIKITGLSPTIMAIEKGGGK
jgi:ABC-2 type transport system ATP-binding protein